MGSHCGQGLSHQRGEAFSLPHTRPRSPLGQLKMLQFLGLNPFAPWQGDSLPRTRPVLLLATQVQCLVLNQDFSACKAAAFQVLLSLILPLSAGIFLLSSELHEGNPHL